MTNINDDNEIDLGLALGCTTTHNNNAEEDGKEEDLGAGVNASSKVDMAFAVSDPVSELVWSPHNGLSIKCAANSFADKRPFLLWNLGPTNLAASSPSQSGRFKGIFGENAVDEKLITLPINTMGSKSENDIGCSGEAKMMNPADGVDNEVEEDVMNTEKEFCVAQITQTVESCENHAGQGDSGTEKSLLHGASCKLCMGTTEPQIKSTDDKCRNSDDSGSIRALMPTDKESEAPMLPNPSTEKEHDFAPEEEEGIAENDINLREDKETPDQNEEKHITDSFVQLEASPTHSRSFSYRRKGKGKVLSDASVKSKMSNDEDDSHESVESCNNSAGLILKGKKRWHFEQQFLVGSKRIKKNNYVDPSTESTVSARGSSFMTWISNMVKGGFSKSNLAHDFTRNSTEESHVKQTNDQAIVMYDKDHDLSSRSMGFQTVFQSLYCPTSKVAEAELLKEDHSTVESKRLPSSDNFLIDVPPISFHPGDKINQSSAENKASSDIACSKAKDGQSSSFERDTSYKNQSVRSLWITRFSSRNAVSIDNSTPLAQTSAECRIEPESLEKRENSAGDNDSTGSKEIHDSNYERSVSNRQPIVPSAMFKKSEALTSLFARRLDALKHIVPSDYSFTRTTCFFCGRSGHDLRNCSEVTESELEFLIRNVRSYDGAEESSCLCIRCFQLDHWAISCPASSSNRSHHLENMVKECSPSLLEIKQGQGHPIGKQFRFSTTSGPTERSLKERIMSSNLVSKDITDVPKGIFDVIRGLRLSRVDILKWMNSNISLSHLDGFFLRLRLGKLEAGQGGTGYYVACISDLKGEKLEGDFKNCVSVNVCGVKCFVGSQYVSNRDFLEDELTAWWHKTLESGGKVPTEGDLRVKLDERLKLGF